jgi:CHAT domain-containing protein
MLFLSESGCLLNFYLMGGGNEVHLNEITSLLSTIKERCNELKKNSLQSENELMLDVLLKLIEVFFENIEDPTFRSRNSSMNNFYSKLEGSDFKKYLSNDNPNSGVIKLIDEGNFEKAKKQALKENDFGTLEELEWEVGNEVEAFNNRFEDEKLEIHKLINSSKSLTDFELEQTRKIQKNSLNFSLGRYLINFLDPNNEIIKKSFELVLNNYGVLSNLDKDFYHYLRNADSMFKQQYFYLTNLKQQKLINNSQKIENQANLRDLEFNMKRKLLERKNINASWISFEDIQKTLNDSTVFVLNYKYNYKDFVGNSMMVTKQRSYYLTFLITTQSAVPNFILDSLNSDSEQNMIDLYHNQMAKKSETQDLSFVYEKMWSKIDGQLPNKVKKVILSPDGMYNSVNVSTLFDKNNNKYIFDKYEIVIADKFGAKVVDNTSKPSSNVNSAVLVGFPNYAGLTCSDKENTNDSLNLNLDKYYSNAMRGSIAKSLPGTKIEIEKINNLFTKNGIKTTLLMEKNATEDNLKKVLAPDVLHIATHGFFINSKEGTPMFNSGLLLAGSSSKNKKIEDGYLSAYETSLLNLENTRLVVLSACETGRGVMKDGDGVFGLRQGCINAGAQNIIMSLWKVDDKVTQEFMSRFYEIWLNDKTSIREAFNKTQFEIKAKYPQPYYWGAFILVGE